MSRGGAGRRSNERRVLAGKAFLALAVFLATLVVLAALYALYNKSGPMLALSQFTATATAWFLNLFGEQASVQSTHVTSSRFTMRIIAECTAASSFIIYLAAIVAYPSRLTAKGVGLVMGVFGLFALNQVRTVSLYYVGVAFPDLLEFAHLVMWQSLIVILAIMLWLFWAKRVVGHVSG